MPGIAFFITGMVNKNPVAVFVEAVAGDDVLLNDCASQLDFAEIVGVFGDRFRVGVVFRVLRRFGVVGVVVALGGFAVGCGGVISVKTGFTGVGEIGDRRSRADFQFNGRSFVAANRVG